MPQALPLPIRQEIIRLRQQQWTYDAIATATKQKARTVRAICTRVRQQGEAGLLPDYHRCGPQQRSFPETTYEAALALKREHPRWGAEMVRLELLAQFPKTPLPKRRTLQSWFQQAGLQPGRARHPSAPRDWAREAHAVWQLDGKEGMHLADGTPTAALNLVDEATGAVLSSAVFPPETLHRDPGAPGPGVATAGVPGVGASRAAAGG